MPTPQPVKPHHQPPVAGFSLEDTYYTFFRHKGKIILFSVLGIISALILFLATPPVYTSEAKILIRYVFENKSMAPQIGEAQVTSPDRGENIINSEVEILTSRDLALQVADTITPEKVLSHAGGGTNRQAAASLIRRGLKVAVPNKGNVILIAFNHPDPAMTQPILTELIEVYLKKHREIHEGVGVLDDFFSRQADQSRFKLTETEKQLKKLRTEAKVVVQLEETKKAHSMDLQRIQESLFGAESDLAEYRAILDDLQKRSGTVSTNDAAIDPVPGDLATRYQEVCALLESVRKRHQEQSVQNTAEHPLVKNLQSQITDLEAQKKKMETENPRLLVLTPSPSKSNTYASDLATVAQRVRALTAKVKVLKEQKEISQADAIRLVEAEPEILQKQRKRDAEEDNLRYYSSALEQSRIDETLGTGKITNIGIVQQALPPYQDAKTIFKAMGAILFGGIFGGLALAFILDRVLDLSVKRTADVERHGGLPLLLSLPDTRWKSGFHLPKFSRNGHGKLARGKTNGAALPETAPQNGDVTVAVDPQLQLYHEALRDRVMTYFDVRNMTHKPKLVGITSCHRGAGVSTVAAGLADSLSETGEGNVLLVDMNGEKGSAHPIHGPRPGCGLSEALELDKPETAFLQEKLYLVSVHETKNNELPRVLPKRFAHLIPRMKASDYDYIIFDMPPVNQTSVTPRLSGYMDMVLVVIESEKTGQEVLKRVTSLLRDSAASAAAVLNKNRKYIPARFSQEL